MNARACFLLVLLAGATAGARERRGAVEADDRLAALWDRVAADLRSGRPLVIQAHVALCDNRIIRCGGRGLGDGDDVKRNLYWATSGGFRGWFDRRGSAWKSVYRKNNIDDLDKGILEVRVWHRRVEPSGAWRARGVKNDFDVYVVAQAWRGLDIDGAIAAFRDDLAGEKSREIVLSDGTRIDAGGAAQVVGYVGHNRWMDRDDFDWGPSLRAERDAAPKGIITVACWTKPYLATPLDSPRLAPLLVTRDFMFAGAHAFDGAASAFAAGEGYAGIRLGAARGYATGEKKTLGHVQGAFTNPSDKRWR